MNAFFDVPAPQVGWFSDWVSFRPPARAALESGAHAVVAWEALLAEGLTCDALLRCHPRSVAAWVRKNGDTCITMADVRAAPGGSTLTAEALLTRWVLLPSCCSRSFGLCPNPPLPGGLGGFANFAKSPPGVSLKLCYRCYMV